MNKSENSALDLLGGTLRKSSFHAMEAGSGRALVPTEIVPLSIHVCSGLESSLFTAGGLGEGSFLGLWESSGNSPGLSHNQPILHQTPSNNIKP